MANFNFTVKYKKGADITYVDNLSRLYGNKDDVNEIINMKEEEYYEIKRYFIRMKHEELVT